MKPVTHKAPTHSVSRMRSAAGSSFLVNGRIFRGDKPPLQVRIALYITYFDDFEVSFAARNNNRDHITLDLGNQGTGNG